MLKKALSHPAAAFGRGCVLAYMESYGVSEGVIEGLYDHAVVGTGSTLTLISIEYALA
jgi:hypothetical protein